MQTVRMLKFTPTLFDPSSSSIIQNKPQIHYTNFTNNKPCHLTNFPKICTNNKPLHIASCIKKDNADASSNSVSKKTTPVLMKNNEKKLQQLLVSSSVFEPIVSAVKQVFSSVIKSITPYRFVVKNDLILFEHEGEEIVGEVQRVAYHPDEIMEFTLLSEHGLLKNYKISSFEIINQTSLNEFDNEKMWRICTVGLCKDGDWKKMVEEIKDVLNAHEDVNGNSKYNLVILDSYDPDIKILANGFVTVSKLKTPRFEHYMEVRRKVLSEIDEIRIKHGGSKEEDRIKLIRSR